MHCGFCGTNISELTFFVPSIFASTVMPNFEYNYSCCCSTSYFGFFFFGSFESSSHGSDFTLFALKRRIILQN